jgi:carbon monoxide dehydrogenase subunit G
MVSSNDDAPITGSVQRRISAPMDMVYSEVSHTDTLLATMPLEDLVNNGDGCTATFIARIGLGPLSISRTGSGRLVESVPPKKMVFELTLDDGSLTSLHTTELTSGGDDETVLTYTVELSPAHPMPRLRRFLKGVFDLHVRDYAERVSSTAARHWKAEQALGLRAPKETT